MLKEHPEIVRVEVQGHTDNTRLARRSNKALSRPRAEAVMRALVKRGIAERRLDAKGYGQDKPIADNDTDDGPAEEPARAVQHPREGREEEGAEPQAVSRPGQGRMGQGPHPATPHPET